MVNIGCLIDVLGEVQFEWRINGCLRLSISTCYESPEFYCSDATWKIEFFITCTFSGYARGIGLRLQRKSGDIPLTMDCSFRLKTVDGKTDFEQTFTKVFDEDNGCSENIEVILITELSERKSELLPSGVLTVICSLKESRKKNVDGNEDSKKIEKNPCIESFTQTNQETGIENLRKDYKEMFLNGNYSDVVLKLEGQEYKSHRCILAARSPVFLSMMMHDFKEKATGVVDIKDVDTATFPDFLDYLYTGSVESVTSENAHTLYATSDLYQVNELKNICLNHMLNNISIERFCDVFSLSLRYGENGLKETCIQFFVKNSLDIVMTSKWQLFLGENPTVGNELFIKQLKFNKR